MESAPAAVAVNDSPLLRRCAAVLLLAAVALWLFAGQGGLSHPVQLTARGCVIIALACVLLRGNLMVQRAQLLLLTAFFVWGAYSGWHSGISGCVYLAHQELLTWGTAAVAALVGHALLHNYPSRRWWLALVVLLVVTAVPELVRNLRSFGAEGWRINLIGLPGNSNVLGVLLAVCVPAVAAAIADARDRRLGLLALPLLLAGLLLTYSRNAWLTAGIGFAVWWYLSFRGQRAKLLVLLTAIVLVLLVVPATRARLHSFIDPQHPSNIERVDILDAVFARLLCGEQRLIAVDDGSSSWEIETWFRGRGIGQWGYIYPRFAKLNKWQLHTHNVISEWLMGGGIPLTLLGILLIFSGFWGRISGTSCSEEILQRSQFLILVVANQFDYLLWLPLMAYVFFVCLLRLTKERLPMWVAALLLVAVFWHKLEWLGFRSAQTRGLIIVGIFVLGMAGSWKRKIVGLWRKEMLTTQIRYLSIAMLLMLLATMVVVPAAAYSAYVRGLSMARDGQWQEAKSLFMLACQLDDWHPVYDYYRRLAFFRTDPTSNANSDADPQLSLADPYFWQQYGIAKTWTPSWQMEISLYERHGDTAAAEQRRRQTQGGIPDISAFAMAELDPRRMIAGGEEFPQRARVTTPWPAEEPDWRERSEGELLNRARNWEDSFPAAAQEAYRLALRKDVRYTPAYRYYAEFLQRTGQWQTAIAELTPALAVGGKRPEDAAVICAVLAAAHAATGDTVPAQRLQQQAQRHRDNMITRHAQVIRMLFHIPTLPREGFNDD